MIAGNIVSFFAALFTFASAGTQSRKHSYLYQAAQCLIMAFASVFFQSASGVTTFLLCAVRNLLLAFDRFTPRLCAFFVAAVAVVGLAANNRGLLGLLPVLTTALYTVGCFFARRLKAVKANLAVNLSLWALYDCLIRDYVSMAVDSASAAAALASLLRRRAEQNGDDRDR